jgi:hypothetical protein
MATRRVLEKLAPRGGLIVQDGNNIPFSSLEKVHGLVDDEWPETDLAEIYGLMDAGNPAWRSAARRKEGA